MTSGLFIFAISFLEPIYTLPKNLWSASLLRFCKNMSAFQIFRKPDLLVRRPLATCYFGVHAFDNTLYSKSGAVAWLPQDDEPSNI